MIKIGKDINSTIADINQEFSTKVDKTTKVATVPLSSDVSSIRLLDNLFVISKEVDGVVVSDPFSRFDNCVEDIEDWGSLEELK